MKILWLCGNPGLFHAHGNRGGGWTGSLQMELLKKYPDIELINVFSYSKPLDKERDGNVTYYPIYRNKIDKAVSFFDHYHKDKVFLNKAIKIIREEKPDIIECWGTELGYGLVAKETNIPVAIHIQGFVNPILASYLPSGYSMTTLLRSMKYNFWDFFWKQWRQYKLFALDAKREIEIMRNVKYLLGRTEWDKSVSKVLAPQAKYFYCSESLRPEFVSSRKWEYQNREKLIVTSVINNATYKGADVILKTAKLLKEMIGDDFRWEIYGVENIKIYERANNIKALDVNVRCMGRVTANIIVDKLLNCDVFCHESYIENSPNSVCEAQFLGVPVVAAMVGGVDTLMRDGAGIMVPANDAYRSAVAILNLKRDKELAVNVSSKEIEISCKRHSGIAESLMNTYNQILIDSNHEYCL